MLEHLRSSLRDIVQIGKRFKLRRTPTGASYALADSVDMLNAEHWDALTASASVFLSRRYLRVLDQHRPDGVRQHAALVYLDGEPVAALSAQSLHLCGDSLPRPSDSQRKRDRALMQALSNVDQRVLVCGNLLSWGNHGVALAPGADIERVWPAIAEALYRIRKADSMFGPTGLVLIKDRPLDDAPCEAALGPYSYRAFDTEPDMRIELLPSWRTFDDYLASLRKDYRKAIKTVDKHLREAGVSLERLSAEQVHAERDAIHDLYLAVQSVQRFRLVTLEPSYLPALATALGDAFITTVLRTNEGKLAGFVTTVRDGAGAVGYFIGFDKTLELPLYLRLLHAVIEDAISLGARSISFGRTALDPKARLGCEPHGMQCYVRHRIDPMNVVVRRLLELTPEPELPPERSPFKVNEQMPA
ncbi:MAG TPA: GNAT family N-acetyltransferase [Polyangiales bacterium]|nr:GNAT family N-acetyltransferase [Polyangiales bacterium]